jgi:hypothetical protein
LVIEIIKGGRIKQEITLKIRMIRITVGSILAIVRDIEATAEGKIITNAKTGFIKTKIEDPTELCIIPLQEMTSTSLQERKII